MNDRTTRSFEEAGPQGPAEDWGSDAYSGINVLWGRVATLVVALLVAFVLGRISAPDGVPASKVAGLQKQIAQSRQQIGSLQSELADAQAAAQPSPQPAASAAPGTAAGGRGTTYEVKSGDTLNSIAVDFYGSSSFADYLAEANHLTHPGRLTVGQKLHIPPKP